MNKKKISFVIGALKSGGSERVITNLSNQLVEKYEVHIICLTKSEPFYELNSNVKLFYCKEQYQPSNSILQGIKLNYALYKTISNYLKKEKINLFIGFITSANILAILASRKNNIPCIISERNYTNKSNTPLHWRVLRKLLYKKAEFLVVQTEEMKKQFEPIINNNKIVILKNPIAPELTHARDINYKKENLILNVGSLINQKAQDVLIKAFANIDNANWKLIIIGKGEKQKVYEELIKSLNLDNKITLLGQTKDIAQFYNKSKIFAFTSLFEGSPNALIEAMHFGLACVSTDCPTGPSELITDNHSGYLIPINDQKKLELCLKKLMNDQKLREKFSTHAIQSVASLEAKPVTLEWIHLFEKVLN
ncbi:glycosyltransferase [Algibacter luteus]|uniref:GalNAc-alpha-(1->4)-GalNAc-alpha-(1->3)-diNAcBac-PP-undecaprenol alpha-1,4-N-acetyl-D-galactosaminyltransferase n=1 Tax=Algibacter luteus TaxID=1178825 RepID=A0A1M6GPX7_9FLAO|nr:glycosyltransferase [Algibacter luteus]SHJ11993.1 GalNAc-alpha-(1->4)-GalNAc-alpha-(1->3)-diNAcBac-PP-undecaprenol alpha-1,4-N-acetyl-D-galactosaminyltransferase [Algibacter luteus]